MSLSEFQTAATFEAVSAATVNLDRFAEENNLSPKQKYCLDLIYEELMTNVAKYSFHSAAEKHFIRVQLQYDGTDCTFTMSHDGIPFDPWQQENPALDVSLDEREEGGVGIFLTRQFSKSVSYEYKNGINIVSVIF